MRKNLWAAAALAIGFAAFAAHADVTVAVPPAPVGAAAFMVARNWLWAEAQLLALVIPALFLFTGLGARLRTWCARVTGGRRYGTLTLFAIVYLALNAALMLPFDYYRNVTSLPALYAQSPVQWAVSEAVQLGVRIVVAALFLWIPYALIARSPKRWWLYAAAALVPVVFLVLVVLPVWVDPLTTSYHPLQDKALNAEIQALAARCGVHNIPVLVGGNDTTVVGLGPTNRIILGEDVLKHETPPQLRMTVGHELKHYVEGDNYKALAIICVLLLVGFFISNRLGRGLLARFGKRFGFTQLSDPASLPLFALILTAFYLCVLPAFNWYGRSIEHEADRFGLELTHENRALAQIEAAYITRDHDSPDWDTFFLIFRATHPSDADRIRFANDYHPWEEGKPLVYGDVCR
ncbi:MAG TPA: M48 family metalloprotease [Rhizomicrobium sp.]|jgi:Zn-dependent protease with chaperone function|nr:M48 family metalloprotease [Rhizomicrobium sp.]